MKVLITCQ